VYRASCRGGGAEKRSLLFPSPRSCKQRRAMYLLSYRLPVPLGTPPLFVRVLRINRCMHRASQGGRGPTVESHTHTPTTKLRDASPSFRRFRFVVCVYQYLPRPGVAARARGRTPKRVRNLLKRIHKQGTYLVGARTDRPRRAMSQGKRQQERERREWEEREVA